MAASFAGWPASTSTTTLPVCSSVRPTRDCSPNSNTASNSSRRRTRVATTDGTSRTFSLRQNGANSSRSANSGGTNRKRENGSSPACRMASLTKASKAMGASSTAARNTDRNVSTCERLSTNPARWAASCTLSVNTSAFFSAGSSAPSPNSVDRVTDSSVATAEPRNRIASLVWHDGQVSCCDSASASCPVWVRTGSTQPSRRSRSSSSGGAVSNWRCRTENQRRPSTGAASPSCRCWASSGACNSARNRPSPVAWCRRMAVSSEARSAPTGASSTPQPDRPQCRQ